MDLLFNGVCKSKRGGFKTSILNQRDQFRFRESTWFSVPLEIISVPVLQNRHDIDCDVEETKQFMTAPIFESIQIFRDMHTIIF